MKSLGSLREAGLELERYSGVWSWRQLTAGRHDVRVWRRIPESEKMTQAQAEAWAVTHLVTVPDPADSPRGAVLLVLGHTGAEAQALLKALPLREAYAEERRASAAYWESVDHNPELDAAFRAHGIPTLAEQRTPETRGRFYDLPEPVQQEVERTRAARRAPFEAEHERAKEGLQSLKDRAYQILLACPVSGWGKYSTFINDWQEVRRLIETLHLADRSAPLRQRFEGLPRVEATKLRAGMAVESNAARGQIVRIGKITHGGKRIMAVNVLAPSAEPFKMAATGATSSVGGGRSTSFAAQFKIIPEDMVAESLAIYAEQSRIEADIAEPVPSL